MATNSFKHHAQKARDVKEVRDAFIGFAILLATLCAFAYIGYRASEYQYKKDLTVKK